MRNSSGRLPAFQPHRSQEESIGNPVAKDRYLAAHQEYCLHRSRHARGSAGSTTLQQRPMEAARKHPAIFRPRLQHHEGYHSACRATRHRGVRVLEALLVVLPTKLRLACSLVSLIANSKGSPLLTALGNLSCCVPRGPSWTQKVSALCRGRQWLLVEPRLWVIDATLYVADTCMTETTRRLA